MGKWEAEIIHSRVAARVCREIRGARQVIRETYLSGGDGLPTCPSEVTKDVKLMLLLDSVVCLVIPLHLHVAAHPLGVTGDAASSSGF